jgi:hypothetical protein
MTLFDYPVVYLAFIVLPFFTRLSLNGVRKQFGIGSIPCLPAVDQSAHQAEP